MTKKQKTELLGMCDSKLNKSVIIVNTVYDRRYKLDTKAKDKIRKEFAKGKTTLTKLAKKWDVSPTTIARTVDEAFHQADNAGRKFRANNTTPSPEYPHELATYKRQLIVDGAKVIVK